MRKKLNNNQLISIHPVAVTGRKRKSRPTSMPSLGSYSSDKHQNRTLMSAASRPDESISGDAGKKKKKEGEKKKKKMKKKELIGKWFPAEQTPFGGETAGKARNLLCNLFHCCAIQNILELTSDTEASSDS